MSRGFNLLIAPDAKAPITRAGADAQEFVHRFELDVQCESTGQPWHATLTTHDGRHRLEFESLTALTRTLAQLTLRPPSGAGGTELS